MTPTTEVTLHSDGNLIGPDDTAHLTAKELALLLAVVGRKGGILTKQAAMTELYGGMDEPEIKIIDVFICKVRNKLLKVGALEAIETVFGQGYRWSKNVKLDTPDSDFLSMEVTPELARRLEDLALASNCTVGMILHKIVAGHLTEYEDEVWA